MLVLFFVITFFFAEISCQDNFSLFLSPPKISSLVVRLKPQAKRRFLRAIVEIYQKRQNSNSSEISSLDEIFILEDQEAIGVKKGYREDNNNRYNFKLQLLDPPSAKATKGYEPSVGARQNPKAQRPPSWPSSSDVNIKKIEQDLIAYEAQNKNFSDDALSAMGRSALTYEEQKAFLSATNFQELDAALQEKIAKDPHIMKNKELFQLINGNCKPSNNLFSGPKECRSYGDTYLNYVSSFLPVTSKKDIFLTASGFSRIKEVVNKTLMARGKRSPFVVRRNQILKCFGFRDKPLMHIDKRDFFVIDALSKDTAAARAELLMSSSREYGIDLMASIAVSNDAFEARLELLQQAHLYQHAEFRALVEGFPEYEAFVRELVKRLNHSLDGLKHLFNIVTFDLLARPVQNLASYFRMTSCKVSCK